MENLLYRSGSKKELNYRPLALTSQLQRTQGWLLLNLLGPQVQAAQDSLQFAYQAAAGAKDAILHLLHRVHLHLDKLARPVRILFLDFSSSFSTIPPPRLQDKLTRMRVHPHLVSWISDYLADRWLCITLRNITSVTVICSTGIPQGAVLPTLLFHHRLLLQPRAVPHAEVCWYGHNYGGRVSTGVSENTLTVLLFFYYILIVGDCNMHVCCETRLPFRDLVSLNLWIWRSLSRYWRTKKARSCPDPGHCTLKWSLCANNKDLPSSDFSGLNVDACMETFDSLCTEIWDSETVSPMTAARVPQAEP